MFLYRYFTAYKTSPIVFEEFQGLWFSETGLNRDKQMIYDMLMKIMGTTSAILMIWIGYYSTEKTHEQLVLRKQISAVRVFALAARVMIELLVPAICMTLFIVGEGVILQV